jgi:hypothetical protein
MHADIAFLYACPVPSTGAPFPGEGQQKTARSS